MSARLSTGFPRACSGDIYAAVPKMIQRGEEFSFTFKPCQTIRILGKLYWQRLDGNFPTEFRVTRTPHFTHSTLAEECADLVVAEFGAGFHV